MHVGTLDVRVRGNTIVPSRVLNRFSILCAILRQLHLVLQISLFSRELADLQPDVFFIDQLSACVPLLRSWYCDVPVLFYCHFPDKLLATRQGLIKKLYRIPFDWWESWSTGCSNTIVVNSNFTKSIFSQAFSGLRHRKPEVVYPCVDVSDELNAADGNSPEPGMLWNDKRVLLSINRFERKKEIGLAIRTFAGLDARTRASARLVAAGGYDHRIQENVSYHKELQALAESLRLKTATATNLVSALSIPEDIDVLFLLSVPTSVKTTLLKAATLLIYTPKFEHFGIVPLEAMLSRVPVLAARTGGPKETVVEGETGWLRDVDDESQWTEVMDVALTKRSNAELRVMGEAGQRRVVELFSQDSMAFRLEQVIEDLRLSDGPNTRLALLLAVPALGVVVALIAGVLAKFS